MNTDEIFLTIIFKCQIPKIFIIIILYYLLRQFKLNNELSWNKINNKNDLSSFLFRIIICLTGKKKDKEMNLSVDGKLSPIPVKKIKSKCIHVLMFEKKK